MSLLLHSAQLGNFALHTCGQRVCCSPGHGRANQLGVHPPGALQAFQAYAQHLQPARLSDRPENYVSVMLSFDKKGGE